MFQGMRSLNWKFCTYSLLLNYCFKWQFDTAKKPIRCYRGFAYSSFVSVPCPAGRFKSNNMKMCETCAAGTQVSSDKTSCGKRVSLKWCQIQNCNQQTVTSKLFIVNNSLLIWNVRMSLFSVSCSPGDYKSTGMTKCKTCPVGEEPNSAKTACGKIVVLILITNLKIIVKNLIWYYNNQQFFFENQKFLNIINVSF